MAKPAHQQKLRSNRRKQKIECQTNTSGISQALPNRTLLSCQKCMHSGDLLDSESLATPFHAYDPASRDASPGIIETACTFTL